MEGTGHGSAGRPSANESRNLIQISGALCAALSKRPKFSYWVDSAHLGSSLCHPDRSALGFAATAPNKAAYAPFRKERHTKFDQRHKASQQIRGSVVESSAVFFRFILFDNQGT